jgi:hypothetical protein
MNGINTSTVVYLFVISNQKMKYIIILIFILGVVVSCESDRVESEQTEKSNSEKQTTFNSCFDIPDTNYRQYVLGCCNTFYKLIKNKRVLSISTDSIIENGYCTDLINDSANNNFVAELKVFDSELAVLSSVCSDLIFVNQYFSKHTRTLTINQGQIVIGKVLSKQPNGSEKQLTTILVKTLNFKDTLTGELIKIENELLWQVEDIGTPG